MESVRESAPARAIPRPDPIPVRETAPRTAHATWVVTLGVVVAASVLLDARTAGLLACGAASMAIAGSLARAAVLRAMQAVHFGAGVIALAFTHGPEASGTFAIAAGFVLVAALLARATALGVRRGVAPLAGRLPWRFERVYRSLALQFGVVGLAAGTLMALLAPGYPERIVGVAMLPLALRTFTGNLLAAELRTRIWTVALALHLAVLLLFAPRFGVPAAAWALVVAETALFAGTALVIARRTGVTPFEGARVSILVAGAILVACIMVPATTDWTLLASIAAGIAAGIWLFRQKT